MNSIVQARVEVRVEVCLGQSAPVHGDNDCGVARLRPDHCLHRSREHLLCHAVDHCDGRGCPECDGGGVRGCVALHVHAHQVNRIFPHGDSSTQRGPESPVDTTVEAPRCPGCDSGPDNAEETRADTTHANEQRGWR